MLSREAAERGTKSREVLNKQDVRTFGERSAPTNVSRARFPYPASYVGWVCCWFFSLLREVFFGYSGFPSPQKPTFPNSISIWNCQALYHEPLARVIAQALPVFDIKFTSGAHLFTFTFLHYRKSNLYLKTERWIHLKLLVWRGPLFILRLCD